MHNILLIGIAGFIGSNFVSYLLNKYPEYTLVNLNLLAYTGNLENLKECECNSRDKFIKGNIRNRLYILDHFKDVVKTIEWYLNQYGITK